MPTKRPKDILSLVEGSHSELKFILDKLSKINELEQLIKAKLHDNLAQHCRVINAENSFIVLAVDSPAWKTRLEYQLPALLSTLRNDGMLGLASIQVTVSPPKKTIEI